MNVKRVEQLGGRVDADKTELVYFTRMNRILAFKLPKMDRKKIKLSNEVKYIPRSHS